jgi:hypothetical protein
LPSLLQSPFLVTVAGGAGGGVGGGGGGGGVGVLTVMVVLALALPPVPLQARLYVEVAVRLPVVWLPFVVLVPLQAPLALQEVALLLLQVRVAALPEVRVDGEALKDAVGASELVVTLRAELWADSLPVLS